MQDDQQISWQQDIPVIRNGPEDARDILILAHGAGASMDSPFMDYFAGKISTAGVGVVRFEFPYMVQRRLTGKKRPPDRQPKLLSAWHQVIAGFSGDRNLYIGGKSMGGRMASLIADELWHSQKIKGLICLGYPFYAPGRQDRPRTEHLENMSCPALIVQGVRDAMGNRETVAGYNLSEQITVRWSGDGNHDLSPRKKSGLTPQENWDSASEYILDFIKKPMK